MPPNQLSTDVALGVTIPARNARGRIARIGPVLDSILASHSYPPAIEALLAEALATPEFEHLAGRAQFTVSARHVTEAVMLEALTDADRRNALTLPMTTELVDTFDLDRRRARRASGQVEVRARPAGGVARVAAERADAPVDPEERLLG